MNGTRAIGTAVGVLGVWSAASTPRSFAHPTPAQTHAQHRAKALCTRKVPFAERLDPVRLGQSEGTLRNIFDKALVEASKPGSKHLRRTLTGTDIVAIRYDVHAGRVYRIRWRLAERFEVPILDALVVRGRLCFGRPAYDQTLKPKAGRLEPVVRRIGWRHGAKRFELRQVHPLTGGPVYLSITDHAALQTALKDRTAPPDEPTTSWWRKPRKTRIPGPDERRTLADAFGALLAQLLP